MGRGAGVETAEGVYVNWRLLREDDPKIAFNVFRQKDGARVKLNATPITQTTDFLDTNGFDAAVSGGRAGGRFKGASQTGLADRAGDVRRRTCVSRWLRRT